MTIVAMMVAAMVRVVKSVVVKVMVLVVVAVTVVVTTSMHMNILVHIFVLGRPEPQKTFHVIKSTKVLLITFQIKLICVFIEPRPR